MKHLAGFLVVAACGGSAHEVSRPAPKVAEPVASPAFEPRGMERLARWVDEIPAATGDGRQRVARTLDLLADYFVRTDPRASRRLEQFADSLATGGGAQASLVREAISLALDSLATEMRLPADSASRSEYMMARRARVQISPSKSIDDQLVPIAQSLRAVTNLVALHRGEQTPFAHSRHAVEVGHDAEQFRASVQIASDAVHLLAAQRDWRDASKAAGDALDALADAIAVAPLDLDRERWRSLVREIRYRGSELSLSPEGIDRSQDVKAGLRASSLALRGLQVNGEPHPLGSVAVAAVEQIADRRLFALQRAAIQESFRATADLLLFVVLTGSGTSDGAQRAPQSASVRR